MREGVDQASRDLAERIAGQIGDTLASLGASPDALGVQPVIREVSSFLWPQSGSSASAQGRGRSARIIGTLRRVASSRSESPLKRAVRRLARPVLSSIDGRVADINSRVELIGNRTEDALDAYTRSASEASSYIGIELRRIHDRLPELEESSFEYYKMRLASAVEMPLEKLDEPLAQAINYATSHHGFFAQAGLWFNPPVAVELSAGAAAAVQVTERIVEVPFAMAALSRLGPGTRILDIGSAESTFPLSAASLGYRVTAIDPRPLAYSHPNLESHAALLEDWDGPPGCSTPCF